MQEDKLTKLLSQKHTAEDLAEMVKAFDAWMNCLMALYGENLAETDQVLSEGSVRIDVFEKLGRDGRRLKALATESLAEAYAALAKKRLAIERAIETLGRANALADANSKYRINLSSYLIEEIRRHQETYQADQKTANARLWAAIEGAQL